MAQKKLMFILNIFLLFLPSCYSSCDPNIISQEIFECSKSDDSTVEKLSISLSPLKCSCLKSILLKLPQCQSTLQKLDLDYQSCLRRLHDDPPSDHNGPRDGTRPPEHDRPHDGTRPPEHDGPHDGTRPPHDNPPDGTPPPSQTGTHDGSQNGRGGEDNDNDEPQSESSKENNSNDEESHGDAHISSSAIALISVGCAIVAAILFGIMMNVLRYRHHTPTPPRALVSIIPMVDLHDTLVIVDSQDYVTPSYVAVAMPVNHSIDEENQVY